MPCPVDKFQEKLLTLKKEKKIVSKNHVQRTFACEIRHLNKKEAVVPFPKFEIRHSLVSRTLTGQLNDDIACLVFVFWPLIDTFWRVYLNIYYASDSVTYGRPME